ncbi:GNAT family N-acetyltransferase [bacterium D16-54]|nr:GNAT family N-acetyltransferase [bacterium D16-54]RKJ11124.1 GNAT family N-acetyltransferase [bacterium D16-56]
MEYNSIQIRTAAAEDAWELLKIYKPYVKKTAITFEYDVPTPEEFKARIENTLKKYPYLVAEKDGELLGYVYTGPFVGRAAYGWAAEVSIYLKEGSQRLGLGKRLYQAIEEISRAQNILNLNACIGSPETEDEYLTRNSIQFHSHMGYRWVGEFYKCGYKFGRWYNMVWMEKIIGEHPAEPMAVIPFPELDRDVLDRAGVVNTGSLNL